MEASSYEKNIRKLLNKNEKLDFIVLSFQQNFSNFVEYNRKKLLFDHEKRGKKIRVYDNDDEGRK